MSCLGCFRIEEIRDKDNGTGLKEGEGIEMLIYSAFHIRDARSIRLNTYLIFVSTIIFQRRHLWKYPSF